MNMMAPRRLALALMSEKATRMELRSHESPRMHLLLTSLILRVTKTMGDSGYTVFIHHCKPPYPNLLRTFGNQIGIKQGRMTHVGIRKTTTSHWELQDW